MGPGRPAGRPVRVLRPRPAGLPDLPGQAADPRAGRRPAGRRPLYTARGRQRGQQVFLAQRADGVRVGLRPRRVPRARTTPPTTCAARRTSSRAATAAPAPTAAAQRTIEDFRTNRYDERTGTLTLTAAQAEAHRRLVGHYTRFFSEPTTKHGLRPERHHRPRELRAADRVLRLDGLGRLGRAPGHNYSYTNNWPPEPRVDNKPTANVVVWSVLSLIALLGGIGILFGVFGRWGFLGWHGREQATLSFRTPGDVALTPAQRAMRLVLLRDGGAVPDSDVRRRRLASTTAPRSTASSASTSPRVFPYNLMRTWHVQLALFWVATSFVAAGHLPGADDRRARAQAPGQAGVRAARARWRWWCSAR